MAVVNAGQRFVRFDVWLFNPDPAAGSEIRKTRPCVVVSPDTMNDTLNTVIVAPMTTTRKNWPSRIPTRFKQQDGDVALDQMRAVDKGRLIRRLGRMGKRESSHIAETLVEMFWPDTPS